MLEKKRETVSHIVSECENSAQKEYKRRQIVLQEKIIGNFVRNTT